MESLKASVNKFQGKDDVSGWLDDFNAKADAFGVMGNDRYQAMLGSLDGDVISTVIGEARLLDNPIPKSESERAGWLEKELRRRYSTLKSIGENVKDFWMRKMSKGESLEAYVAEKKRLFTKFVEAIKRDKGWLTFESQWFLEELVEGLPRDVRFVVKEHHPIETRVLEKVVATAKSKLSTLPAPEMRAEAARPARGERNVGQGSPKKQVKCFECGEKGHVKWQCPKLKEEKKRDSSGKGSSASRAEGTSAVRGSAGRLRFVSLEMVSNERSSTVKALIDTGASTTVIARRAAEKISTSKGWQERVGGPLRTANGSPLKVLGVLPLTLRLGGVAVDVKAVVADDVEESLLLGDDSLEKLQAMIDYRVGGLVLPTGAVLRWEDNAETDARVAEVNKPTPGDGGTAISRVLEDMKDVFGTKARKLGAVKTTRHHIPLTSEVPVEEPLRRTSRKQDAIIKEKMKEMLEEDVIEKAKSEYAAPVVLARKKDRSWRFCVDYRKLNSVTRRDPYPLPRIDEILDRLGNARVFSKVDVRNGYWHVLVAEEDRHKTAFITKQGTFQFKRMPFGLTGAPATFNAR